MGLAERSYYSSPPPGGPSPMVRMRMWNVTTWLIAINVAVFVLDILTRHLLWKWGDFSVFAALQHGQVWRFITFQFLHADVGHIFFNMLSLYFFGTLVEGVLGPRKYLAYYLICGTAGAVGYLLLWRVGFIAGSEYSPLIGASAGVFGVLIACVKIAPNMMVRLLFPPVALQMRTLALCFIGFAVLTIISHGNNAGGEAAHLGGAVVGWLLMSAPQVLNVFERRRSSGSRFWKPGDPGNKFFR